MTILGFIFAIFRYFNDLAFFLSVAVILFLLFLLYESNEFQTSTSAVPKIVLQDSQEVQTDTEIKAVDSSRDMDEGQISFLMVSSPDISENDLKLVSGFDRLRAQSKRTIQSLATNRRRMAQKSSAARVRKERLKRAHAAFYARHPNF